MSNRRYMPGLDGLRAISVVAVIVYHLNFSWASGGFLGVGIFFVLSGYLITDQLLIQWEQTHRLHLIDFWIRRARRLLPALFVMLLLVAIWLKIIDANRLEQLQGDILSSIFYVNNWWLIVHEVSYFESFGPPTPFGHIWSLAIEEQFYILWPILLIIFLAYIRRRSVLTLAILLGTIGSALAMAYIYEPGMDPSRVYYGTDTRAFALLIGAGLAVVWPSMKQSELIKHNKRVLLDSIGVLGLFLVLIMIWQTSEYDTFLYGGGLLLLSVLSAVVIAVLAHPDSRLAKLIGCRPMRWLGVRSYSLYIWHYPVIVLTTPTVHDFDLLRALLQIGVSIFLASLSYKYVEEPIRRGLLGRAWQKVKDNPLRPIQLIILSIAGILIAFSLLLSGNLEHSVASTNNNIMFQNIDEDGLIKLDELPTIPVIRENNISSPVDRDDESAQFNEAGELVTVIGDSVILGAIKQLEEQLPGIVIDGKVSRQMIHVQEVIDQLRGDRKLRKILVLELGTNGPFTDKQLRAVLTSLEEVEQVILVNTRVPRNWQDTVNSIIGNMATELPNIIVVDWYKASSGKTEYFSKDGVHLTSSGAQQYATLIAEAVQKSIERLSNAKLELQ